ncbi:hypothetical protein [Paenibacillus sp. PL91]|nr:hypothetical protein [Paenibacillus sp. PL91]MBC9202469.1 hypothetical protein [Paenibacillus sp. PL91]
MQIKWMSRTLLAASALVIALQTGRTANNNGMNQVYAEKAVVSFAGG